MGTGQFRLILFSKLFYAAHDAKNVVVNRESLDLCGWDSGGETELQDSGIDAGEVEGAGGLVLLWLEGEGVHVDALVHGHVLVVLEWLHQVVVGTVALCHAVLAVQLELSRHNAVGAWVGGIGGGSGGVVGPVVGGGQAKYGIALHNPDQLLGGVIQVELDTLIHASNRLIAGKLELLNQIFMRQLSKAATLVGIQEDVIDPERCIDVARDAAGATKGGGAVLQQVLNALEIDVDLDLMVLQSNQREGEANVAAEPELQGDMEQGRWVGVTGASNRLADHGVVAVALASGQRQLVPDVHEVGVVLVDLLTTDLDVDIGDQAQTNVVYPGNSVVGSWQRDLQIYAVDQIAVTADLGGHAAAETASSIDVYTRPFGLFSA